MRISAAVLQFNTCHGPQMRAIQMTSAPNLQIGRDPNWMAHTPVGYDKLRYEY